MITIIFVIQKRQCILVVNLSFKESILNCVAGIGRLGYPTAKFVDRTTQNWIGFDINDAYVSDLKEGTPGVLKLVLMLFVNHQSRFFY